MQTDEPLVPDEIGVLATRHDDRVSALILQLQSTLGPWSDPGGIHCRRRPHRRDGETRRSLVILDQKHVYGLDPLGYSAAERDGDEITIRITLERQVRCNHGVVAVHQDG